MQLAHRLLSTRGGTVVVSGIAAVLAAAILLAYLHQYRQSVSSASAPMTVLVAKGLIEKGTPGNVVGSDGMFQAVTTPRSEVKEGAITDPATLRGTVALEDVYPGEQLTAGAFSATGADTVAAGISGGERAMSVPVDVAHGMIGNIRAGDRVDVYAGFNVRRLLPTGAPDPDAQDRPVLKLVTEDVLVLGVPAEQAGLGAAGQTSQITLRLSDEDAAKVAFSSDNGVVWVVLRPRTGAEPTRPDLVTLETVLFGVEPVAAVRSFGGRS